MATAASRFSFDQLAQLSGVAPRTIRFYIQMELVPRPNGSRRGAWYDDRHLETLLRIRRLTEKGLSLEAVRRALSPAADEAEADREAASPAISTRTHLRLAPGLELVLEPMRAPLSPAALRRFAQDALEAFRRAQNDSDDVTKPATEMNHAVDYQEPRN